MLKLNRTYPEDKARVIQWIEDGLDSESKRKLSCPVRNRTLVVQLVAKEKKLRDKDSKEVVPRSI